MISLVLTGMPRSVYAGFGITPPYVENARLTRGTVYEQKINLVRSDPTEDLRAELTINVPGAQDWISINRGTSFMLPTGETQVPILVTVRVPENAEYKEYKGVIRIRTSTDKIPEGGGVSIALGAQIDVSLKVVDKIYDFEVRRIRTIDVEEGRTKWGLFFPGKIRLFMTILNTGNTDFGPTKVKLELFDAQGETLLETTENTNDIEKVGPFATREVVAELPTRLPAGRYVAKYSIYKNEEIAQQNQIDISISPVGTVLGYEGYGFTGLSTVDKTKAIVVVVFPLLLLAVLVFVLISRRKKRRGL